MAQTEGFVSENFSESKMVEKTVDVEAEACPPAKKFKQGRLPFKPLDSCQTLQGTSPTGSKKRKLSENESPSAKQLKSSLGKPIAKSPKIECDPEVSSSSEADTSAQPGHQKGAKKMPTIDRFFKRKPEAQDQAEISSTNECIAIDLTDDNSVGTVEDVTVVDTSEKTKKCIQDVVQEREDVEKTKVRVEEETTAAKEETDDDMSEIEDKENVTDGEAVESMDDSFVSDTSICESALKTPAKEVKAKSVLKTPVASSSKETEETPSSSKAIGSDGEGTPVTGKKRTSISGSKKKEQDAMRQKLKEEREREKEEKRLQKEKEKEDKEKERLEKKKQKEEERLEKERLKQEEKDKKEQERLEKLKQKEEEKKQKQKEIEMKMEEKKKKDEEKKQKEEERKQKEEEKKKEEEEKVKKEEKKKNMFKGFFIQKAPTSSPPKVKESGNSFFMPFEVKADMKLAPKCRASLSTDRKEALDELIESQDTAKLYLDKSRLSPAVTPGKSPATLKRNLNDEDDVEVLVHDKETIEKVTHKVKYLKFHENVRPAYYGTWRKPSDKLCARNPFKQDECLFDYEVDSDDEWEEEEPGESVSSDEEEEEEKPVDGDEEEEEDDWMVPHGYLSDGEGIEDDEEVDTASKQDQQKVRQAAWESELKRQAKPLAMVGLGCIWEDTTAIAAQQLHTLLKYKAVCLMEGPICTSFSRVETTDAEAAKKAEEKSARVKSLRKSVPEEAIPELIRLVHGNPYGIKNLGKEFRMYWKLKTSPESSKPEEVAGAPLGKEGEDKGTSAAGDDKEKREPDTEKKQVQQDDFAISKRQLDIKIPVIAVREKRSEHCKKTCWYVKDEVLKQYNMEDIKLPNSWEYVCISAPKWAEDKITPKPEESVASLPVTSGRNTPNIMQFAQPMSPAVLLAHSKETIKSPVVVLSEASPVTVAEKEAAPSDQRSIKAMFSPASRKTAPKSKVCRELQQDKKPGTSAGAKPLPDGRGLAPVLVPGDSSSVEVKQETSPVLNLGNFFSVKPIKKAPTTPNSVKPIRLTPTTPKQQGYSIINTVLTSPELMKGSSVPAAEGMEVDKMEVDNAAASHEVIVLDDSSQPEATNDIVKQEKAEVEKMEVDVIVLD